MLVLCRLMKKSVCRVRAGMKKRELSDNRYLKPSTLRVGSACTSFDMSSPPTHCHVEEENAIQRG